jgi:hypothetical protein
MKIWEELEGRYVYLCDPETKWVQGCPMPGESCAIYDGFLHADRTVSFRLGVSPDARDFINRIVGGRWLCMTFYNDAHELSEVLQMFQKAIIKAKDQNV